MSVFGLSLSSSLAFFSGGPLVMTDGEGVVSGWKGRSCQLQIAPFLFHHI